MTNTDPVVSELLELVASLRARRPEIEHMLAELDDKIRSVEVALQAYAEEKNLGDLRLGKIDPNELAGMTQMKALKAIAERNGGLVNASDAKRVILAAGLSKGKPKNLGPHLYGMLKDSDEFVWHSPGTFKLIATHDQRQPTLLHVS